VRQRSLATVWGHLPRQRTQERTTRESTAAHFDGRFSVPDEPFQLPIGQRLLVKIELVEPLPPLSAALLRFASDLPDLSAQHDHYLYGAPKRRAWSLTDCVSSVVM
jgi:hypothetical protein